MRCFLILFLFGNLFSFSQEGTFGLKEQLEGTWWLNAVQAEQFADNASDNISSGVHSDYSITFMEDSVFFRAPDTRFYKKPEPGFSYSLSSDSILKTNSLHLFRGKGKHRKELFLYEFKLVNNELILSNSCTLDPNHAGIGQINYYTYSRFKDDERFYEKILGKWVDITTHPMDEKIADTVIYVKKNNGMNDPEGTPCSFIREQGETRFFAQYSYSLPPDESGIIDGVYAVIRCNFVIRQNQLIFIGTSENLVYDILELTDQEMRLVRRSG